MELRWQWKSSTRSVLRVQHVSSAYIFHKWGGKGKEVTALDFTSFIIWSATTTEIRDPDVAGKRSYNGKIHDIQARYRQKLKSGTFIH